MWKNISLFSIKSNPKWKRCKRSQISKMYFFEKCNDGIKQGTISTKDQDKHQNLKVSG